MELTDVEIVTAIELLVAAGTTSPTAVCEALERRGFATMTGPDHRRRPLASVFDRVCDVARIVATYRVAGNVRRISKSSTWTPAVFQVTALVKGQKVRATVPVQGLTRAMTYEVVGVEVRVFGTRDRMEAFADTCQHPCDGWETAWYFRSSYAAAKAIRKVLGGAR